MNRGQIGQRIGQRQFFGAVLRFSEFHQAFSQRLCLGVFFRVVLDAEFLVNGDAFSVADRKRGKRKSNGNSEGGGHQPPEFSACSHVSDCTAFPRFSMRKCAFSHSRAG
jgi:hypothetical protein